MADAPQLDDETLAFAARVFDLARHGDVAEMAGLLDHGLPPNMRNDRGDSLLMLAAYNGNAATARLLLERGADPDCINDKGQTPLQGVCFKGENAIVELLLAHGAAVDGPPDSDRTPLMTAAMFDKTGIVAVLLAHGADPARKDGGGLSAADLARSMGATRVLALIDQGDPRKQVET